MNKLHHPSNRAERLRIKAKKDKFENKSKVDGPSRVRKRRAEVEEREATYELRQSIYPEDGVRIEILEQT